MTHPRAVVALVAAVVAVSTAAPLIRWAAPAPALSVATLRVLVAATVLVVLTGRQLPGDVRRMGAQAWWLLAAGALFALHLGLWIASLQFTSVAASVALVATSPVFAAALGPLLGDRVGRRQWLGIAVAGVGCVVLAGGDWQAKPGALLGDALALAAAAAAAGYFIVGRKLRSAIGLPSYLAAVNGVALLGLLAVVVPLQLPLFSLPARSHLAIALCAVIASLLGHSLLARAVRKNPAHLVTLAVLGEPVGASLLTWAAFGESPPLSAALGGAVILVGIGVGFASAPWSRSVG
jgi:drug/metabolite transporter (DMT)-like permease